MWVTHYGDCLEVLSSLPGQSVDAVVTDPPYGLEFMGKKWDAFEPYAYAQWCGQWAAECMRVLKPGGYLLACGGTRTYHRLTSGIEDAGFEIRDSLIWIHGQGFPKNHDVSKAIDKAAGAEREVIGPGKRHNSTPGLIGSSYSTQGGIPPETAPATAEAQQWAGWGTALKPAHEPIVAARKPAVGVFAHSGSGKPQDIRKYADAYERTEPATEDAIKWQGWGTALKPSHESIVMARKPFKGTVASNVLEHGTGAINIDACRVAATDAPNTPVVSHGAQSRYTGTYNGGKTSNSEPRTTSASTAGRWPANVVLSHSPDCVATGIKQVKSSAPGVAGGQRFSNQDYAQDDYSQTMTRSERQGYADVGGMETVAAYDCTDDCPVAELDRQSGQTVSRKQPQTERRGGKATNFAMTTSGQTHEDSGGASRFFMQCAPDCPVAELDRQSGELKSGGTYQRSAPNKPLYGETLGRKETASEQYGYGDQGGASRFFYCAKAPKSERPVIEGVEGHPTVKPLALMRWLVRMVCPPGGLILDPFAGTGTTAEAAELEGFDSVLIESDSVSIQRIYVRMNKYESEAA